MFVAIFAPFLAPYPPQKLNLFAHLLPGPSSSHWLGVDQLGRDEFCRILYGARYSLVIGIVSVTVGLSVGIPLGAIAGYFGGFTDAVIMRSMDIMLAIPGLLLAIGIVAALGAGLLQIMIAIGITNIPSSRACYAGRCSRSARTTSCSRRSSVGIRRRSILFGHILPNSISPVIVGATLAMATAIIDVAGLGFLGLGPQDPATPEWGTMLTQVDLYLQSAPFLAIVPGIAIVSRARLQPDRRRAARGARSEAARPHREVQALEVRRSGARRRPARRRSTRSRASG